MVRAVDFGGAHMLDQNSTQGPDPDPSVRDPTEYVPVRTEGERFLRINDRLYYRRGMPEHGLSLEVGNL